jgi:hypothetical protein
MNLFFPQINKNILLRYKMIIEILTISMAGLLNGCSSSPKLSTLKKQNIENEITEQIRKNNIVMCELYFDDCFTPLPDQCFEPYSKETNILGHLLCNKELDTEDKKKICIEHVNSKKDRKTFRKISRKIASKYYRIIAQLNYLILIKKI